MMIHIEVDLEAAAAAAIFQEWLRHRQQQVALLAYLRFEGVVDNLVVLGNEEEGS